ncbi:MAG: hypothetical protein Kow00127_22390 [Bacteroidales bacterium]
MKLSAEDQLIGIVQDYKFTCLQVSNGNPEDGYWQLVNFQLSAPNQVKGTEKVSYAKSINAEKREGCTDFE